MADKTQVLKIYLNKTNGILRMVPDFIPCNSFLPGRRLRLHRTTIRIMGLSLA